MCAVAAIIAGGGVDNGIAAAMAGSGGAGGEPIFAFGVSCALGGSTGPGVWSAAFVILASFRWICAPLALKMMT